MRVSFRPLRHHSSISYFHPTSLSLSLSFHFFFFQKMRYLLLLCKRIGEIFLIKELTHPHIFSSFIKGSILFTFLHAPFLPGFKWSFPLGKNMSEFTRSIDAIEKIQKRICFMQRYHNLSETKKFIPKFKFQNESNPLFPTSLWWVQ